MKKLYMRILEILFPKGEDEILIEKSTHTHFLQKYHPQERNEVVCLSSFTDPQVRAALHLNKFHKNSRARELLSILLLKYLSQLPEKEYLLIPIPLSLRRERTRGYNQVTIVAKTALMETTAPIVLTTKVLQKNRDTKPQTSLTKEARLHNLTGAFFVPKKQKNDLVGKHIILLDDVTTTGTTLHEAKAVLLLHNPTSITCVALAS